MMIINTASKSDLFPKQDLDMVLRDELMLAAEAEASMHGTSFPLSPAAAALAPVTLDSLVVVELLCAVEPVLGFAPSDATVRAGGYHTVQEALDHLLPKLEHEWKKRKGVSA